MSRVLRVSLEEQQRVLGTYMKPGAYRTMALLYRKMDPLMEMALKRAMLPSSVEQYGCAMFEQSLDELERETWEELADALNRQAVYDARIKGWRP